jgi:hypothetical protein
VKIGYPLTALLLFVLSPCTINAGEPNDSNRFVFDSRGVELMRKNKDILGPWVSYTIARAACVKSQNGNLTFSCEALGREMLVSSWVDAKKQSPAAADPYLDALLTVNEAGFLKPYVWVYFGSASWEGPPDNLEAFQAWASTHLTEHNPETHVLGEYR